MPKKPARPKAKRVEKCVAFGYKCAWIAAQVSAAPVAKKLLGADARRASWSEGVDAAYAGSIFVTPNVDGWVFVVSTQLFEYADDPESIRTRVAARAQFFASDRVIDLDVGVDGKGNRTELGDEEAVMKLAGTWGMNPQKLASLPSGGELGWVADRLVR